MYVCFYEPIHHPYFCLGGHVSGMFRACVGHVLAMRRACFRQVPCILSVCAGHVRHALVVFSHVLDTLPGKSGKH